MWFINLPIKDILIILVILAIIIAVCFIPVLVGRAVTRHLKKTNPNSVYLKTQDSADIWLAIVFPLVFLVGSASLQLTPEGKFAVFLRKIFGVDSSFIALMLVGAAISLIFVWLRYILIKLKKKYWS
jgi:hypothetical protein